MPKTTKLMPQSKKKKGHSVAISPATMDQIALICKRHKIKYRREGNPNVSKAIEIAVDKYYNQLMEPTLF